MRPVSAALTATMAATPTATSSADSVTVGRISAKITEISASSAAFSASSLQRTPWRSGDAAGSGSAAGRQVQSGTGARGRTTNHSTASSASPNRAQSDPEPRMLGDGVGEVELRDVDPVLLRQLHEDPEPRRRQQPEPRRPAGRVPAQPDRLVDDEEVLERVGEHQQHRALARELEREHADEPVVEEELADPERGTLVQLRSIVR